MSTRRVNLFGGPLKSLNKRSRRLKQIRFYSIFASLVLFAVIFGLYLYRAKVIGDIYIIQQEEDQIEQALAKESGRQKDLETILLRVRRIEDALKNDVMYASRSASLTEIFGSLDSAPRLDLIDIPGPQDFKVKLAFSSQEQMLDFIRVSETKDFGSKLSTYSIGAFKITLASDSAGLTTLDFSGTFL